MAKKNRIFTGLLAAMVVFVMLFASFYIISETGHHCVGDDCPICCQISVLEGALKSVSFASCAEMCIRDRGCCMLGKDWR